MTSKIVLAGPAGSGKTTLFNALTGRDLPTEYIPTMGADVRNFLGTSLWDCSGDEKYACLQRGYYIGASTALVVTSDDDFLSDLYCDDLLAVNPEMVIHQIMYDGTDWYINNQKHTPAQIAALLLN